MMRITVFRWKIGYKNLGFPFLPAASKHKTKFRRQMMIVLPVRENSDSRLPDSAIVDLFGFSQAAVG